MKSKSASKQHGAIGLMMAVAMLALVLFAALAIDMARLTYQKQALQSVADIAALEVSRSNPYFIDGDMSAIENELEAKYQAQDKVTSLEVRSGSAKIEDSQWVFSESEPSATAFNSDYSAAQVVVTKSVPQSMIAGGLFGDNTVVLTARAAIQKSGVIRFGIGTELLNIDSAQSNLLNSVLSGLLGTSIDLGIGGYQGLADTKIMIGSLVNQVGIASVEEVLSSQLELANLSDYLNLDDGVGKLLDQVSQLNVTVGDIIGISPGRESAALATTLSALDIIRAAAISAGNGKNGIDISIDEVIIPGVTDLNVEAEFIESPQFEVSLLPIQAGSEPSVSNEQINLRLKSGVKLLTLLSVTDLTLEVEGATAEATIVSSGQDGNGTYINIEVTRSISDIRAKLTALLGLISADIQLSVNNSPLKNNIIVYLTDLDAQKPTVFDIAEMDTNKKISFSIDSVSVSVLGLLNADLAKSNLVAALNGLLDLVMPILSKLGLSLNETTIWVDAAGTTQYGLIK